MQNNSIDTRDEFSKWMESQGQDAENYVLSELKNIKLKNWYIDKFKGKAKNRFLERKSQYDIASYSIIRVNNPYLAREILIRAEEKENTFEELAIRYSEGPEKETLGMIKSSIIEKAHPVLAEVIRTAKLNEIRGPFQIEGWNVLVRIP